MSAVALSPIVTPSFVQTAYPSRTVGAFSHTSFVLSYTFLNNGQITGNTTAGGIGPVDDLYTPAWSNWDLTSSALDSVYEVMCTVLSGPALNFGNAVGVWWPLVFVSPRRFGQSRSFAVDGPSAWANSLQFDIRSATTGIILATETVAINGTIF